MIFFSAAKSRIEKLYARHEKYAAIALFVLGFIWDSLTLRRVDSLLDNIILLGYLVLIGILIIFTLRRQRGRVPAPWVQRLEVHFPWAIQFCFGGLFSSYVVFYSKSASFTQTQFFFLVLVILLIANEFLQHRLQNPALLAVFYCFCFLSFLAFFLPVILARVGAGVFMLASGISLVVSLLVFAAGLMTPIEGGMLRMRRVAAWICAAVAVVNVLYFANLIPPVPLALKSAGIYHSAIKTPSGYLVQYVSARRLRFWRKWDSPFYLSPGESVYCYTAIFAPGRVRVPVRHVWSRRMEDGWVQTDRIGFPINGGRERGYRGYTVKHGVVPGKWRVEVETERGQTLGRIDFDVVVTPIPHPPMETHLIR
jgi:hypothetical protein